MRRDRQAEIVALAGHERQPTLVYTPRPSEKPDVKPESRRKRAWKRSREAPTLQDWRERMTSAAGQLIYQSRRLIETVNGQQKNGSLRQVTLRGLDKVGCQATLQAFAHNIRCGHVLRMAAT